MCDKFFRAVITVRVHSDKYKRDVDAVDAFLTQYIGKRASMLNVKIVSVSQTRPAKWQNSSANSGTFKGKIE